MATADEGVEVLRSVTGTIKRSGPWRVPPRLKIMTGTGAVKLDFREATLSGGAVDIEVTSGTGAVDIVLPKGATADVSGLTQGTGNVRSGASAQPDPPLAHFAIHGVLGTGGMRIAYKPKVLGLF